MGRALMLMSRSLSACLLYFCPLLSSSSLSLGGVASASEANVQRRDRLRQLALDTVDITQDPYFMKNHLGTYECKLCLTLHTNEGSYMAHTQGKKHQQNLARRAAKLAKDKTVAPVDVKRVIVKKIVKIGRPGYKVSTASASRFRFLSGFLVRVCVLR